MSKDLENKVQLLRNREVVAKTDNNALQLRLEAHGQIVSKSNSSVTFENKILNEKLQELWTASLDFLEEMNQFHEQKGVSSPWWNAHVLATKNPEIQHAGLARRQRQRELDQIKTDINQLQNAVTSKKNEMHIIKSKIIADEAKLLELKRMEEELQQEPFGSEFLSIKAKIESCRQASLQLSTLLAAKGVRYGSSDKREVDGYLQGRNFKQTFPDEENAPSAQLPGFVKAAKASARRPSEPSPAVKVIKMREQTTLVYRRNSTAAPAAHRRTTLGVPREIYNTKNDEEEVMHA